MGLVVCHPGNHPNSTHPPAPPVKEHPAMVRSYVRCSLLVAIAAIGLDAAARAADRPIHALLVAGGCCHDYKRQKEILTKGVSNRANVDWVVAYDPDGSTGHLNPVYEKADWANGFDVIVHDECSSDVKDLKLIDRILKPHRDGLPAVVLHCGMHCYRSAGWPRRTPWFEFTGLPSTGHGAQAPIAVSYLDQESPITKPLRDWTTVNEELYNNGPANKSLGTAHVLARGKQGRDEFVTVWTNLYKGKARVFGTTLGHNNATVDDSRYLDLVTRGLLWSVDKLDPEHLQPAAKIMRK